MPRLLVPAACAALALLAATPAVAVAPPLSAPRIIAHFDLAKGQQPENIALEPDGSADLTLSFARQIGRVDPAGQLTVLATLPAPATPATPLIGAAVVSGIVRAHDGTLYFGYATGTADLQGIWRLCPGGTPERIAALPVTGLPNGLGLDERAGRIYVTDSALGVVHVVPVDGGTATTWSDDALLKPVSAFGANGLKLHDCAVWVTNTDTGNLLRIPIGEDGTAGPAEVRAGGLPGVDDFAFTGHGDALIAALNTRSEAVYVEPDGSHHTVLTAADGLSNPTSVAVRGDTVYVPSAAYFTHTDPNLLLADLQR
ncbi:hypothetical protein BX285_6136 [Streptomyces sp. 1114.5]|uniref:hypothetical protein n=1 Tax=unclassified Streptomyces TaxID=2593676 RepID=UPI000BC849BB|nr:MULTISPECIES: hypothetical protein [unclassified Streptomyces]RKT12170.1 hypothetical protein BX285_6136 [Streptomyces sp. 1114.5]SOB79745.1 hypothetical protein SAMN06272789_0590 [Streptomyces sp. 1331.2]